MAKYRYRIEGGRYGGEEMSREPDENGNRYIPVLAFHSSEKGTFGCWYLDTDEPFDIQRLAYGVVETNVAELVDRVYYDKEELDTDYDYNDTSGKGYYADVGWLNTKWHDAHHDYNTLDKETWDEFDENVEYTKEMENK